MMQRVYVKEAHRLYAFEQKQVAPTSHRFFYTFVIAHACMDTGNICNLRYSRENVLIEKTTNSS